MIIYLLYNYLCIISIYNSAKKTRDESLSFLEKNNIYEKFLRGKSGSENTLADRFQICSQTHENAPRFHFVGQRRVSMPLSFFNASTGFYLRSKNLLNKMLQSFDKLYKVWYTMCMLTELFLNIYFFGYTTGSVPCMKEIIHAQYRVKKLLSNGGFLSFLN